MPLTGGGTGNFWDSLFGGSSDPVADPMESFFTKKGADNRVKRTTRPFGFEQLLKTNIVNPESAPIMEEAPPVIARKRQTQGSSLPEAVKEIFRAPGGLKSLPEPEYADSEKKEEQTAIGKEEGPKEGPGFFGELLGGLLNPEAIRGGLSSYEGGLLRDDLGLGTKTAPLNLEERFAQGLKRAAYSQSLNEDGTLSEPKLISNLTKYGFGEDAFKLQANRQDASTKAALELSKITEKTRVAEKKKLDDAKAEEDFLLKHPEAKNAKVVIKAGNKTYTIDPTAVKAQRLRERKEAYQQHKQEFVEGIPALGGGGGGGQAPGVAQRPQVGQAPGRIQPGPGGAMDAGGRFPAAQIGQAPGATIANPREWNFSQRFTPELNPMTRPKTTSQAIKREQEIKKELKEEFGKTPIKDEAANRDKLNRIQRSVGKVDGENLMPNVDTGQYKGIVGEYMRNPEFEELRAQFRRLSFENIPKGMSRLFDSEAERKMYEEAQPAMTNNPKTNWNIIQHMRSDLDRSMEYRRFKTAYGLKNQTTEGADEAWTEYTSNNPSVVNNTKGVAVDNGLSLSPKDYFAQDMQGAKPLPIDWNEVNKKYKNVNQPIVNVPDSTISNLKDDETYMFPGGARTGSQLKAMKKRVNERGGK
jgi:hypothetical protein